jgi:acetyl-CoA carboxylase carboxyltransferase component
MYKGRLDRAQSPEEKSRLWQEAVARMKQAVERFSQVANEDLIDPRQTRALISQSLKCVKNKTVEWPAKKHENINL